MSAKRMTANPLKAPRYRPGKAVAEEASSSSEEEDIEEENEEEAVGSKDLSGAPVKNAKAPPPKATTARGIRSDLSKVDLNERRREAERKEVERVRGEEERRAKEEEGFVTESEDEEGGEGGSGSGSGEEEGSSEVEESSEEEEAPRRVMLRPTFIKKDKRGNVGGGGGKVDEKSEEELAREEEERKRKAADELVEEQIRKDIAAREAGRKNWDDDEVGEEEDVDDTDGLDPEAEHAAWKLRELKRIKREREAIEEREKEREEIERRKALTEEERKREDDEFIAKQKEEREGKGKAGYLQKYYHKGAFFQDDAKAEGLDKRDIMGARFADEVDRELLPQALQMRDMTKVGKKGATKYRDLKSEDTGRWGQFDDRPRRAGEGGFPRDERFMSDREREKLGASGANNIPVGERKKVSGAPEGPRAMRDDGGDSYRPRRDYRSRSRSRSPYYESRKRPTSRDADRSDGGDKRRRVDSR